MSWQQHKWVGLAFSLAICLPVNTSAQELWRVPVSGPTIVVKKSGLISPEARQNALINSSNGVHAALNTSSARVAGAQHLPAVRTYLEMLQPEAGLEGSLSIGTVGGGQLTNASTLAFVGGDHEVIERHRRYGTAYATDEMTDLIQSASAFVNKRSPGAPLRVGNMSKAKGGDIRWSRSHNSGRDADLAFYVRRVSDGKSVPCPGIVRFDENGVPAGHPDLEFDVARNWLLVRGMIEHPVNVQYLFISLPLKAKLLQFAAEQGEDQALIAKASGVLHQPTDALPHDDHFHLRIACSKDDRLRGCVDSGPRWEWEDWHDSELLAQALEASRGLQIEKDEDTRMAILDYLESVRSPFASEVALTVGVRDPSPPIRERAWQVARYTWPWSATTIVAAIDIIEDPTFQDDEKRIAYSILRRSADPIAFEFAVSRLGELERISTQERVLAARTLRLTQDRELVPTLLAELARQPAPVRSELADVLRRLTNRPTAIDWAAAGSAQRTTALADWTRWYAENQDRERSDWVLAGMRTAGVKMDAIAPEYVDTLLGVLPTGDDFIVYNANRLIRELTGRWAPLEQSDGRALHKYWVKWWKKNRDRVLAASANE